MPRLTAITLWLLCTAPFAQADVELSFYGGLQSAPPSDIAVNDPVIGADSFSQPWEGRSLTAPPYYGVRATSWSSPVFGFGLEFTHAKVYPEGGTPAAGYDVLEFTDGVNTLTVNAYRRWDEVLGNVSPYLGGGLGLSLPHVEVTKSGSQTLGYQITGPAATVVAGAQMPLRDNWSVFGEYKGTVTANTADLSSGGTLETDIMTNALNFGVSFDF